MNIRISPRLDISLMVHSMRSPGTLRKTCWFYLSQNRRHVLSVYLILIYLLSLPLLSIGLYSSLMMLILASFWYTYSAGMGIFISDRCLPIFRTHPHGCRLLIVKN